MASGKLAQRSEKSIWPLRKTTVVERKKSLSVYGEAFKGVVGEGKRGSDAADVNGVDAFTTFLGFKFYLVILLNLPAI